MSWVVVTTAPDQLVAEMWRNLLIGEGVSARIRDGDTASFLGVSGYPCRIMVREEELDRARAVLDEHLESET